MTLDDLRLASELMVREMSRSHESGFHAKRQRLKDFAMNGTPADGAMKSYRLFEVGGGLFGDYGPPAARCS
jgi:hypothetical protein